MMKNTICITSIKRSDRTSQAAAGRLSKRCKRLTNLIILLLALGSFTYDVVAAPPNAPAEKPAAWPGRFRIRFYAYDGDSKKPEGMIFQVNTLDLRQPTEFLKIGDMVRNTKLKLVKFEQKLLSSARVDETDVSELTVTNVETNESTVLVLSRVQDIPSARKAK